MRLSLFGRKPAPGRGPAARHTAAEGDRIAWYSRYQRAYEGYSIRGTVGSNVLTDWRRIKFNYNEPIVNLGAGFMAAKPIDWEVQGDRDATALCYQVWQRSGGDRALLTAAISCAIYGDMALVAAKRDDDLPVLEFVDPSIVYPTFHGADHSRLESCEIAYRRTDGRGEEIAHREMYGPDGVEIYENDVLVDSRAYEHIPVSWIRNAAVMGNPFGISDLHGVWDLVEEYDHIASKQTRIIDYYAAPTIVFKGLQAGDVNKKDRTVFFLPSEGASAEYLEWKGNTPDVDAQLTRIRNAIAERSQVPAVAFGQSDSGLTSISGVALQILYGPLITKTLRKRASWSPSLERAMWLCLREQGVEVDPAAVRVVWPDALPVDGREQAAIKTTQVAAQILSRRTAMNDAGVENPDEELRRIVLEQAILALSGPGPSAYKAAQAATKGSPGDTSGDPAGAQPAVDAAASPAADIAARLEQVAQMLKQFDDTMAGETRRDAAAPGGDIAS
jgi:hypothetical protein